MTGKSLAQQVLIQGLVVVAGSIVAALLLRQMPELAAWIDKQWGRGTGATSAGGCGCGGHGRTDR